tara:strand:- start:452 stop:853 length:402 start_codon:yes stop_codon:yes gene_type:complete
MAKYIPNKPFEVDGEELKIKLGEDAPELILTPHQLLKFSGEQFPGDTIAKWRPVNEMLDKLKEYDDEPSELIEIENAWWTAISDHLDKVVSRFWGKNAVAIWDDLLDRMAAEADKRSAADESKHAKGSGKQGK